MEHEHTVLACVDQSPFSAAVTDYAAWAAQRLSAPLELLHVIDQHPEISHSADYSGSIGIDSQEQLLNTLSQEDAVKNKSAREVGRILLNHLRERSHAFGIDQADIRQRQGNLVETLSEQEHRVRLFVLGRYGETADLTQRAMGRNVEAIARRLQKPVLMIAAEFSAPKNICIAFDGGLVTRRGVEMIAASPLFRGLAVHVLMSGRESKETEKKLHWAKAQLEKNGLRASTHFISGQVQTTITQFVTDYAVDLLVMGRYSHTTLQRMVFGSKTADLLRVVKIPALLLR